MNSALRYDLIVFDWDGTIMDSLGTIVACAQASSRDLGLREPVDREVRDLVGLHLQVMAQKLTDGESAATRERWVERYRHHWIYTYHDQLAPLPGARETLEILSGRGFPMAVATGKRRRGLNRDFESTGLGTFFLASRTVDESPSKPSPHMLHALMDELGVRASRTLMIGDTTHDTQMAENAGVPCVGVLTGSHDQERLLAGGAFHCLPSVIELPDWLG